MVSNLCEKEMYEIRLFSCQECNKFIDRENTQLKDNHQGEAIPHGNQAHTTDPLVWWPTAIWLQKHFNSVLKLTLYLLSVASRGLLAAVDFSTEVFPETPLGPELQEGLHFAGCNASGDVLGRSPWLGRNGELLQPLSSIKVKGGKRWDQRWSYADPIGNPMVKTRTLLLRNTFMPNEVSKHRVPALSMLASKKITGVFPTILPAIVTGLFGGTVRHYSGMFISIIIFFSLLTDYRCNSW